MNLNNRTLLTSLGILLAGGGLSPALSNLDTVSFTLPFGGGRHSAPNR
ncbi:hypothetical protein MHM_03580 [Candidatus Mycoplasma haemominutum 'Birmingham 1']|uniref:Uncharacterized protein n=1 Tax=Candidatus Mycoplasma haematominutum 'Birmingham 1' TaxID=1116213 RepID=G8C3H8_9MOLU|nr:hypothetical protein MHM_03580 [Candidatus Mycoplasma haematominutum 'Birmingham 1']